VSGATIKDVVINLALNGAGAVSSVLDQVKEKIEGLHAGRGSPLHSLLANSFGPGVAQASMTATNVVSLVQSLAGSGNHSRRSQASNAAQAGGFDAANLVQGQDGIWRLGTVANEAASGLKALGGPATLLAAGFVATLAAVRSMNVYMKNLESARLADETKFAGFREREAGQVGIARAHQGLRFAMERPNEREFEESYARQVARTESEASIRQRQEASGPEFGMRQEIRSRAEAETGLQERERTEYDRQRHLEDQRTSLLSAQEKLKQDREASAAAFERTSRTRAAQFKRRNNAGFVNNLIGHAVTGSDTDAMVDIHNEKLKEQQAEANVARQQQITKELEAQNQLSKAMLENAKEQGASAEERLNILRESVKVARVNAERDAETIASGQRSIGALTPGGRTVLQNLSGKIDRIKGGSGESLHEGDIRSGAQFPVGTVQHDFMLKELERRGEGIGTFKPELKASQEKAKEVQNQADQLEPNLLEELKQKVADREKAGRDFMESLSEMFGSDKFFIELDNRLKALKIIFEKNIDKMGHWIN